MKIIKIKLQPKAESEPMKIKEIKEYKIIDKWASIDLHNSREQPASHWSFLRRAVPIPSRRSSLVHPADPAAFWIPIDPRWNHGDKYQPAFRDSWKRQPKPGRLSSRENSGRPHTVFHRLDWEFAARAQSGRAGVLGCRQWAWEFRWSWSPSCRRRRRWPFLGYVPWCVQGAGRRYRWSRCWAGLAVNGKQ